MPTGVVKFFNPAKGFGFISPDDGADDVFVHISAVQAAGLAGLDKGDRVAFELEMDRRSGRSAAVGLQHLGSGPAPAERHLSSRPHSPRALDVQRPGHGTTGSGAGVVKWFNATKGFGFIQPNDGGEDVFVHASALQRAGLMDLNEGQAISYDLEIDRRSGKTSAGNLRAL